MAASTRHLQPASILQWKTKEDAAKTRRGEGDGFLQQQVFLQLPKEATQ
jgi:hypothetical protein